MRISYTAHGAARKVPGSKHVLEIERGSDVIRILTDCGIEYNNRYRRDPPLQFDPKTLDAVLFTHGHADHVGELPTLVARGYRKSYYCTPATKDIVRQQLLTEQRISQWRAENPKKGKKKRNPRFTVQDVDQWMQDFKTQGYRDPVHIAHGVTATFYDAGHIIGSAQILYEVEDEQGRPVRILMSGDLGRRDHPTTFIQNPDDRFPKDVDYVLMESTRGKQTHPPRDDARFALDDIIQEAYAGKSRVICGAFSIMRTQLVLDDLFRLYRQGRIPKDFPIYLDSPSALEVNEIVKRHRECYDLKTSMELDQAENAFAFPNLRVIRDKEASKKLNKLDGPLMIIASSGMWDQGRIVYHVMHAISDPNAILVQTGYQAGGTLGRRLREGPAEHPKISIKGYKHRYRARLREIHGYSGHADIDDITQHLAGTHPKGIFLVHGEERASNDAASVLSQRGFQNTLIIPERYRKYELDPAGLKKHLWTP